MAVIQIIRQQYPYSSPVVSGLGQLSRQERMKRARSVARRSSSGTRRLRWKPRRAIDAQRAMARRQAQEAARRPPAPPQTPEQVAHAAEQRRLGRERVLRFLSSQQYATGSTTTVPSGRRGYPGVVISAPSLPGTSRGGTVRQVRGRAVDLYKATPRFVQEKSPAERHAQFMERIAPQVKTEEAPALPGMPGPPEIVPATIAPWTPPPLTVVASQEGRATSALRKLGI